MTTPPGNSSKPPKLKASIDSRSLPIELFGSGRSRHQRKLVFNYLATWANPDGSSSYPSLTRIAGDNGLTRHGVIGIIEWLREHRLVSVSDERSPNNTNNYTVLFSEADQERCREAINRDANEQMLSGKREKAHQGRVRGGKKASDQRWNSDSQQSPPRRRNSDSQQSPPLSDCNDHPPGDSRATMVIDELPNGDSQHLHDRPLPSINRHTPSEQPSEELEPVRWVVRLTARLLSKSFGQVMIVAEDDAAFIRKLAEPFPGASLHWYVAGIWRYSLRKNWSGIDNPRGAWTVFKREIEAAIDIRPSKREVDDFLYDNDTKLIRWLTNCTLNKRTAAFIVMAATHEEDTQFNYGALTEYLDATELKEAADSIACSADYAGKSAEDGER